MIPAGTEIITIRPSNFTETIGVRLDNAFSSTATGKLFEFGGQVNQNNFIVTLKSFNSSNYTTTVIKNVFSNVTVQESIINATMNSINNNK